MSDANDAGDTGSAGPASPTPHPIYNWMSVIGGAVAAVGGTAVVFFFVMGLITQDGGAYAGLLLLPPFLLTLVGTAFVVAGWIRESRRQKRGEHSSFFSRYVVDPWQFVRGTGTLVLLAALAGTTVLMLSAGAGSLAVMEFSESNTFCGEVCHDVMSPEYTAYAHTSHSRVDCVECHVAPGAQGFLAAKIGGMRQLWGVTVGRVAKPIPTPIHGPISRELCESCHSSDRYVGYKAVTHEYFLNGLESEPIRTAMLVKVGGGNTGLLEGSGIHYHMQVAEKVEFVALDEQRQQIAWVRVTGPDGETREYTSEAHPLDAEEREGLPIHQMQCIDCHSRPAHAFRSPVRLVNEAFRGGKLSGDVPNLKEASVRALDGHYAGRDEAMQGISEALRAFYEEEDPDVLEDQEDEIGEAVEVLRNIYRRSIFPEMKADWRAHPDNAGHLESPGCFRCHNDEMLDEDEEPLFSDCASCHAVLAQDDAAIETISDLDEGRGFLHPEDGSAFDEFTLCSDCHTGGREIYE